MTHIKYSLKNILFHWNEAPRLHSLTEVQRRWVCSSQRIDILRLIGTHLDQYPESHYEKSNNVVELN